MNNVYDILLNFNSSFYNFFEWNDNDLIDHIKKICVYRVSDYNFSKILNNRVKVDNSFLDKIFNKSEVYSRKGIKYIPYCVIFGNEKQCIAIKFNKDGSECSRSDLILDEKEEVIDILRSLSVLDIDISAIEKVCDISSSTRQEKNDIGLIINELKKAYGLSDVGKLRYIYYELYGKYECNKNKIYNQIINDIRGEWSYKHSILLNIFNILNIKKQT